MKVPISPCIHGKLCKAYWKEKHVIYSARCPKCKYYEPRKCKTKSIRQEDLERFRKLIEKIESEDK